VTVSSASLLPFAEVQRRLGLVEQRYEGVRSIPVERILGSLDRTVDFDRDFRPRGAHLAARLGSLRATYPTGEFPPISVYEVGGAFFVVDGHHRVALSRQLGQAFIDADVIQLVTQYEIQPDVDVLTLVHTQQHQRFMESSGLAAARPDARFEFLRPDGYAVLLAIIHAYAYRASLEAGRLLGPSEVAAAWYDREYLPAIAAIHEAGLHVRHSYKTDADLFVWVEGRRRALEPLQSAVTWREAAEAAAGEWHGPLTRRRLTAQKRVPLRPRGTGRVES
jgi:hypothetical protein